MSISELISKLEEAAEGDRVLDGPVGIAVGWRREVGYVNEGGGKTRKVVWFLPSGDTGKVPYFTTNIDDACILVNLVAPDALWGLIWDGGRSRAVIGEGPYSEAATPALALCVAALRVMAK